MNTINIIIFILVISFSMTIGICDIYKYKLEKKFEAKLDVERSYRHQLEDRYIELYKNFYAHMDKYH